MVCKLNTRCTVLAATNPCGCYDVSKVINIAIQLVALLLKCGWLVS